MSEQHTIKTLGEEKPRLAELLRDTHGEAGGHAGGGHAGGGHAGGHADEIEQMFTVVRQQLTELTASIRGDLEELRRLASDPPTQPAGLSTPVIDQRSEVKFDSEARAQALEPPQSPAPEVTDDPRYRDAGLARAGAPPAPRGAPEPFRLRRREETAKGIRRIVCGQIDAAVDRLEAGSPEDRAEAVHACRRHFKRVRATARLVRDELPTEAYRRENAAFRDYGRRLSSARDSWVLLQTLDALRERYASEVPSGAFIRLRAALAEDHRAAEEKLREDAATGATIVAELRAARARVATWRLRHNTVSALAPGVERLYRRGRRALRAASKDPTDEHFHELRKRSKDLWHAAQILRPAAPKELKKLGARAHRLSDLVGDDHDLAVLSERADQRPECLLDKGEAALLHSLIARRRGQIQRDAIELAQRIFAAKPHKLAEPVARARAVRAR